MKRQLHGWDLGPSKELIVGDRAVHELVAEFGTPLYIYDGHIIERNFKQLQSAFPGFEISYAIKTNPNAAVCRLLSGLQASAGVSSTAEIVRARLNGFSASVLDFVGPGKSQEDLEYALEAGVGLLSVESEREVIDLSKAIRHVGNHGTEILLRINTHHRATHAGEVMAGGPSPFGVDEEEIVAVARLASEQGIQIVGFHTFIASQVLSGDFLSYHFSEVAKRARKLAKDANIELRILNFGGGFGIPYTSSEQPLDIEKLGADVLESEAGQIVDSGVRCIMDLGRYLTAEAGLFVTKIVDVKHSRGYNYIVTDSGISGMSRPAMPWAQAHALSKLDHPLSHGGDIYKVVGPSCTPGDVLADAVQLIDPSSGEALVVYDAGAYGLTMSLLAWGGFPPPHELFVASDGSNTISGIGDYFPR